MNNQVDLTIRTYQEHFAEYVAGTESTFSPSFLTWVEAFLALIPPRGRILELGSAFGRGAELCRSHGYEVLCTDVVPQALDALAGRGFNTAYYDFSDTPPVEWQGAFDGVFASAVLLHAPDSVFEQALRHVALCLKPGGVAAFSLKEGEGEEVTSHKVGAPRYFNFHTQAELQEMLPKIPFEVIRLHVEHSQKGSWLQCTVRAPR